MIALTQFLDGFTGSKASIEVEEVERRASLVSLPVFKVVKCNFFIHTSLAKYKCPSRVYYNI